MNEERFIMLDEPVEIDGIEYVASCEGNRITHLARCLGSRWHDITPEALGEEKMELIWDALSKQGEADEEDAEMRRCCYSRGVSVP